MLATALVASNMIGSGIFLLPATLAAVGSITVIGWAIGTVGALLIATILAKLSQVAPQPGRPVRLRRRGAGALFRLSGQCALLAVVLDRQHRHCGGGDGLSCELRTGAEPAGGRRLRHRRRSSGC